MEPLRTLVRHIGLEELINCTLVQKDIRNAMLIQPADYNERDRSDPITAEKLAAIETQFPELKQSEFDEGILISKRSYTKDSVRNSLDMGLLLGYPCAKDYEYTLRQRDKPMTVIELLVFLNPGGNTDRVQLMANACLNDATFSQWVDLATLTEQTLKADALLAPVIQRVEAVKRVIVPISSVIQKLIDNAPLSDDEERVLRNEIANNVSGLYRYAFDYTNPLHRGILIGLLTYCENTPLEAFYPLQLHPEQSDVDTITSRWKAELVRVFDATRAKKGGKRTRKNKKLKY